MQNVMKSEEVHLRTPEKSNAPFVLSLLAGFWMLATGGMMGPTGWGGMMGGWQGMRGWEGMHGWPGMHGWMWGRVPQSLAWWPWFGVVAGIVVLVGAVLLQVKPEQRRTWGAIVLAASALDLFVGMGGLLAGTLGVIGGVLAMAAKD